MTENIDHLVLEHLKAIRIELADVKADTMDIKSRLRGLDSSIAKCCHQWIPACAGMTTQ